MYQSDGKRVYCHVLGPLERLRRRCYMTLNWEKIKNSHFSLAGDSYRTKVFGGWLVMIPGGGVTFLPDPDYRWDGNSLS